MKTKEPQVITNLTEFLAWRGAGDTPWQWARGFYKYTDCGPWASFHIRGGEDPVYYEHNKVDELVLNDNCTGIRFGSIVEGSDVEVGPFDHMFPFSADDFDNDVDRMEKETSFYWHRDNDDHYVLQGTPDTEPEYCFEDSWGSFNWHDSGPPDDVKRLVEAFVHNNYDRIPLKEYGEDITPALIEGTTFVIYRYTNDSTYE